MVYHLNIHMTDKLMYRSTEGRSIYSHMFMCMYLSFSAFDKLFPQ
jgi:hypothetical protein